MQLLSWTIATSVMLEFLSNLLRTMSDNTSNKRLDEMSNKDLDVTSNKRLATLSAIDHRSESVREVIHQSERAFRVVKSVRLSAIVLQFASALDLLFENGLRIETVLQFASVLEAALLSKNGLRDVKSDLLLENGLLVVNSVLQSKSAQSIVHRIANGLDVVESAALQFETAQSVVRHIASRLEALHVHAHQFEELVRLIASRLEALHAHVRRFESVR